MFDHNGNETKGKSTVQVHRSASVTSVDILGSQVRLLRASFPGMARANEDALC